MKNYIKRKAYRTKVLIVDESFSEFPDYYSLSSYIVLDSSMRDIPKSQYLVEKYNYEKLEWEFSQLGFSSNQMKSK
jgi:hypothetical protein|tara:strand:- start:3646 stop:3873 length:228 start_codon:yes stop_codon:yes gene_type:complete